MDINSVAGLLCYGKCKVWMKIMDKIEEIYKECLTRIIFSRNTILMIGKEMTCNIANNYIDYIWKQ